MSKKDHRNQQNDVVYINTTTTAILVDGGFYCKRAKYIFGEKDPSSRATELITYCMRHIKKNNHLYRIFYYDCSPSDKVIYHPLTKKNVPLGKSEIYKWSNDFHKCLASKRKVALRMGELLETQNGYSIKPKSLKDLCSGKIKLEDLTEDDFYLEITQKGVDMKMGLDIASIASKKLADQIVLIAGDSDFVPAAKFARREGIDFILDPMGATITKSLNEHIDGLNTKLALKPELLKKDKLCIGKNNLLEKMEKARAKTEGSAAGEQRVG